MPKLRDGSESLHPRFDRLVRFDERSRAFPVRELFDTEPLSSKKWRCDVHLDQGAEGACAGFGVTHELVAHPKAVDGLDAKFAREQIYWEAQKIDSWPGGSYPGASPFYEGTSVLAAIKVAQKLGYFDEYRWAFGLDDVVTTLSQLGPVVLGVNWYEGMSRPDSAGLIRVSGTKLGGHCILAKGVKVKKQQIMLHNSWGPNWGPIGGDCFISFADLDRLLSESGEAVIPIGRHKKPAAV